MRIISLSLSLLLIAVLVSACSGGGGTVDEVVPVIAPQLDGEVTTRNTSSLRTASQSNLYVRIVVTNPNPPGTTVDIIRYCLKFDPNEDDPLTEAEARSYLDPVPSTLPDNIDVDSVAYTGSPQIIEISSFKGGTLSPNERYWISAVFVSPSGSAGPVTTPQRFKLIYKYQLVEPPDIGILKDFQGKVYDHNCEPLPNAFVQYFHEGEFLEATVTEDNGSYYFEVIVPNPTTSAIHTVCCEESEDPTDYVMKVYHPYYNEECVKYLLPEYVHYYVDFHFPGEWFNHNQGSGVDL